MFSKATTIKFLSKLVDNIQRETQKSFVLADVVEEFSKASDPRTFYGIRYYFSGGRGAIRFNYAQGESEIHSIDIWAVPSPQPTYTIQIGEDTDLVKALDEAKRVIKGSIKEAVGRGDADTASPAQRKIDNSLVPGKRTSEDVDKLFSDAFDFTKAVASGHIYSLVLTGSGGLGKSHTVETALKGTPHVMKKGHTSPMGLYMTLHDHPESIIVYDDCDSIFEDQKSVNILKAVLDTKKERVVSWDSGALPDGYESDFVFEGGIIFISNLPTEYIDKKTQGALRSRSVVLEFNLTPEETLQRMERILDKISPNVSMDIKREVFNKIKSEALANKKNITTRALIIGIGLRQAFPDDWESKMRYVN